MVKSNATESQLTPFLKPFFDACLRSLAKNKSFIDVEDINAVCKINVSNKLQDFVFIDRRPLEHTVTYVGRRKLTTATTSAVEKNPGPKKEPDLASTHL